MVLSCQKLITLKVCYERITVGSECANKNRNRNWKKEKEMRMRTIGARGDKWGEINDWLGDDELNFIDGWGDVYDRRHLWKKWPGNQYFMPGLRKNTWSHAIINLLFLYLSFFLLWILRSLGSVGVEKVHTGSYSLIMVTLLNTCYIIGGVECIYLER